MDEIEKLIAYFQPDTPIPVLRRKLRALVRKAETNAFKSGMEAATRNPQWRQYKPFLDQFFGKK